MSKKIEPTEPFDVSVFPPVAITWEDFAVDIMSDFYVHSPVAGHMYKFEPSLTRQEFADECDINSLMARYEKHGVISHVNRAQPIYMDFSDMPDLRESLDIMRDATIAFNSLPAATRYMLDNDPVKFVDFAQNPDNLDKMREWGLAPPVKSAEPLLVKVIPEPQAAAQAPPISEKK